MADHSDIRQLTNSHTPTFGLEPGPITVVHAFWLAGMSCDGCSIAAVGAEQPSVEPERMHHGDRPRLQAECRGVRIRQLPDVAVVGHGPRPSKNGTCSVSTLT